jgi:hypothetical protein
MTILPTLKTCRKGLHQYSSDKKRCPECRRISSNACYARNPDRQRKASREWRLKNPERNYELLSKWRKENAIQNQKLKDKWKKNNPDKLNASAAKRRATKKQAVPLWVNHDAIKAIYTECFQLNKTTGLSYHVDHIYPLKSSYMCGLHVENNLQIILAEQNLLKNNRVWPGQLACQRQPVSAIFPKELIELLND